MLAKRYTFAIGAIEFATLNNIRFTAIANPVIAYIGNCFLFGLYVFLSKNGSIIPRAIVAMINL